MAAITLLAAEAADREDLNLLLGELGHDSVAASRLEEAIEFARVRRAGAFLIVDGGGSDAEIMTREVLRAYPLLPVVVALKHSDASRAVKLLRVGACEVVSPPWTRAEVKACVAKSLRLPATTLGPLTEPRRHQNARWFAFAVGLFIAAGLSVSSIKRERRHEEEAAARVDHWPLPIAHPAGLAFDGAKLWVVDWFSQNLCEVSRSDARLIRIHHEPAETPVGAVFAADAMWTVTADGTISRRLLDPSLKVLARLPRVSPNPAGIAYDGLYLWTLEAGTNWLSKRLLDDRLSVVQRWKIAGLKPVAVVWDGRDLWTLDAADRLLRRLDVSSPDLVIGVRPLGRALGDEYEPSGLAYDGERFWVVGARKHGVGQAVLVRLGLEP